MCGIVYCKDMRKTKHRGVNFKAIELYKAQKGRGQKGFGYYVPEKDRLVHNTEEKRILRLLAKERGISEVLFHHRQPTSTDNTRQSAHPFSTRPWTGSIFKHTYIGVHNGVLRNDHLLRSDHEKLGIKYISKHLKGTLTRFNDSEALIYELALFFEGKIDTFSAAGSMAWVVMELDENHKPVKLHFGRNSGNPLKIHRKRNKFLVLSSEGPGESVTPDTHYVYDYKLNTFTKTPMVMPYSYPTPGEHKTWNPTTRQYEEDNRRELGFRTDTEKVHDTELVSPPLLSPAYAGHRYRNGYYDEAGKWHPSTTPALDQAGFLSYFTPAARLRYSQAIPDDRIEAVTGTILSAANYDIDDATAAIQGKINKTKENANVARLKLEGIGPLLLDEQKFAKLDESLWAAEADLYVYEEVLKKMSKLSTAEIDNIIAEEEARDYQERVTV